ncbi:MAG TPA: ABC transporter permease, partial [Acidobacteriaceae bacterium]|nr:ABC transporter permease [Acidobacteriaceae bacterium]
MFDSLQDFAHDLRIALRQLVRAKTFTATVILTLAVGIGLNAAIFTMVDCVLLRPLGYRDADRIYGLNTHFLDGYRSIPRLGGGDYIDIAQQAGSVEYAAYYQAYSDGAQAAGRTYYLALAQVSPEFMQVMGVQPLAGRTFSITGHNRDNIKEPSEAMASSAFARDTYGAVHAALGKTVSFEGKIYTIVGVLPDGFTFPQKTQLWFEAPTAPEYANRTSYSQQAVVKVRPGVSADALSAELATISKRLQAAYPQEDGHKAIEAVSLQEQLIGKIKPVLRLLMGAVGVVLLIVCANITHLQLVRG